MSINNNIMFVYGSDDFLVDRRARVLYEKYCANGEIFQYNTKTDLENFVKNVHDGLCNIPLFSPTNNIWIRGIKFLGDSAVPQEPIDKLLELLRTTDKNNIIIISASPVDKRKKFFKELSQLSDNQEVGDINEKTAYEFIAATCRENKVSITPDAADALQNLIGTDARSLKLELDKLATYIYGDHGTITLNDVNALVEATNDGDFFQQIERFFSTDIEKTFDSLERYFCFNHEARPLLSSLQNRTRLITQLRALIDANLVSPNSGLTAAKLAGIAQKLYCTNQPKSSYNIFSQNPWYLSKLLDTARNYSLQNLLSLQISIMDAILESAEKYDEQLLIVKNLAYKFKTFRTTH